jgi:hypothetical protein
MVERRDTQFNVVSEPWLWPNTHYIPEVLSLELEASICEQRNLHTDLSEDQIQNALNECPVSYLEIAQCTNI